MGRSARRQSDGCRVCIDRIRNAIDRFCTEELDDEYRVLCHRVLDELIAAKHTMSRSRPESWAAGIIHAAGVINLLNDPATPPFLTHREVATSFGVSAATMRGKSRRIRDHLGMHAMLAQWTVPSLRDEDEHDASARSLARSVRFGEPGRTPPAAAARSGQPSGSPASRTSPRRDLGELTTIRQRWQQHPAASAPPAGPQFGRNSSSRSGRAAGAFQAWDGPPVIGRIGNDAPRSQADSGLHDPPDNAAPGSASES